MNKEMISKTEKITWFERKLNKWVKQFGDSEIEGGTRHNKLITKINSVEKGYRKECDVLTKAQTKIMDELKRKGDRDSGLEDQASILSPLEDGEIREEALDDKKSNLGKMTV